MAWSVKSRYEGFTLAEVLITVGLIGVVAAITLPTLVINVQTATLKKRATIESRKFTQAVENMVAFDDVAGKGSTTTFVRTLESYLKLSKVCPKDDIKSCWPTDSITLYDGSKFGIDQATDGSYFLMHDMDINGNDATFNTDNVAIITQNGTSILLSYNSSCNKYDKNAAEDCVVGLFDSNGQKGPNKLGQDVVLLNAVMFAKEVDPDSNSISCYGNSACIETSSMANSKRYQWFDELANGDKNKDDPSKNNPETPSDHNNNSNNPETCGGNGVKSCNSDFSRDVNTSWP